MYVCIYIYIFTHTLIHIRVHIIDTPTRPRLAAGPNGGVRAKMKGRCGGRRLSLLGRKKEISSFDVYNVYHVTIIIIMIIYICM